MGPAATVEDLKDEDNLTAFKVRSTSDLLIGLFVYKLCTLPWLVEMSPYVISWSQKLHMEWLVYAFIKSTFFQQFCGGETPEECIQTMDQLGHHGIRCILDLSVEADLHLEQDDVPQMYDELSQPLGKWWRQEQSADVIVNMISHCIRTGARGSANDSGPGTRSFAAVKVTGFAPPELLLRLNQVFTCMEQIFQANQVDGYVGSAALNQVVDQVLPPCQSEQQAEQRNTLVQYMHEHQPQMDLITFTQLFSLQGPSRDIWWSTEEHLQEADCLLTKDELDAYDRMINRVDQVCAVAYRLGVGIMIDAEQSYFQEAIDHVAMNMQLKYNRREEQDRAPTVYNTYQMYTKVARSKVERDVEWAKRENFTFAAKLVRGAYMVSERKRASQLGYPSPIHDTIDDTHNSFNGGVKFLLGKLHDHQQATGETLNSTTSPIVFMVASHNRESVIGTVKEMERQGVMARSGVVYFGQLYGMQDQISYTLGKHGYGIFKYLPFGMIDEVIPYLLRRAQENSSVLGSVNKERELMWIELMHRVKTQLRLTPSTTSSPVIIANTSDTVDESDVAISSTTTA
ncbi:FAD-linked oxidoreductase [Hesseltinella vesiculosa]|uniref:Proline dehydrogenase n=1 Tax=Hesseltinella vesiculosa TaxID=101127 RepID=A0A1X2GTI4_9FUNG|nr:FAD-linked oxidoreductase [Hesseltinella vesiculosa]